MKEFGLVESPPEAVALEPSGSEEPSGDVASPEGAQ